MALDQAPASQTTAWPARLPWRLPATCSALLALALGGCGGELPPPERVPRRAVQSPAFQSSSDSPIFEPSPHPWIVGELPEKKGESVKVHTVFDPLLTPPSTRPASRPATQPAPPLPAE